MYPLVAKKGIIWRREEVFVEAVKNECKKKCQYPSMS